MASSEKQGRDAFVIAEPATNLYQISNGDATIWVCVKEAYWTIAAQDPQGFNSIQARIERATIFMKDMILYRSSGIINASTETTRAWYLESMFSMKLEGFGTLSDPKGNIRIASKFVLGKNHENKSNDFLESK